MNAFFLRTRTVAVALGAAVALSACFDDDDDPQTETATPPAASNTVPASAIASSRAYTMFAATLQPSDSAAPLDLGDYVAPTSETEAPEPVT